MSEKTFPSPLQSGLQSAQDQFILEWGRMSSSWGINRTMAQIHALLFVSENPLSVNEIMTRLQISRGNASMNLRELMDWGIVRRFRRPGDRKDTYLSETDPYQMFIRVVRERKRRELDPTADALRECLAMIPPEEEETDAASTLKQRLESLLEVFNLVDAAFRQVFTTDQAAMHLKEALLNPETQTFSLGDRKPG